MNKKKQIGQSLVEYVALTALVAIVSIGTVKLFGGKVRTRLNQITNTFDRNIQQGLKNKPGAELPEADSDDEQPKAMGGVKLPGGIKLPF